MQKILLALGLVVAPVLTALPADAGTATATLAVSATVSANCTISTSALAFGAYDPIGTNATTALTGTGGVTVTCTQGAAATITLGQGANANVGSTDAVPTRRMFDGATGHLSYSLFQDSARAVVWGNTAVTGVARTGNGTAQAVTVYGSVPGGQSANTGSFTDSVVATVSF